MKLASLTGFGPVISCAGTIQLDRMLALTPALSQERVNRLPPSNDANPRGGWVRPRERRCPTSRTLTDNLTLRTRPLYTLSYGDKRSNPWPVSSTGSQPALSKTSIKEMKGLGRSIYFAFRSSKMVRASGNAPEPGTDLVRLRL